MLTTKTIRGDKTGDRRVKPTFIADHRLSVFPPSAKVTAGRAVYLRTAARFTKGGWGS